MSVPVCSLGRARLYVCRRQAVEISLEEDSLDEGG